MYFFLIPDAVVFKGQHARQADLIIKITFQDFSVMIIQGSFTRGFKLIGLPNVAVAVIQKYLQVTLLRAIAYLCKKMNAVIGINRLVASAIVHILR